MRVHPWLAVIYAGCLVGLEPRDAPMVSGLLGVAVVEGAPRHSVPDGDTVTAEPTIVVDAPRLVDVTRAQITVRVYSSTNLAADAQRASLDIARATFRAAAVEVVWKKCGQVACDTPLSATELAVRMVQSSTGGRKEEHHLGDALIDPQKRTGVLATVYVDRTLKLARDLEIDHDQLLGRTVAHEIGHLLLATNAHAASGLMREVWSRDELLRARRDDWLLHPADAAAILQRLS